MNAGDYHRAFIDSIREISAILKSEIEFREIDEQECYLKATITFAHGYMLHLAEYVQIENDTVRRLKYRYQLLDKGHKSISRWDNAPHHKEVKTFPHHRHDERDQVHAAREMTPIDAIATSLEIVEMKSKTN